MAVTRKKMGQFPLEMPNIIVEKIGTCAIMILKYCGIAADKERIDTHGSCYY